MVSELQICSFESGINLNCEFLNSEFLPLGEAVRSTCGKRDEEDHFQKLRFRRGFSGYPRGNRARATDVDFGKMTILYLFLGYTRSARSTDVDFGQMTILYPPPTY